MKKVSLATILVLSTIAVTGAFAKGGFQDPNAQAPQQHHHKEDFKTRWFHQFKSKCE